MCDKFGEKIADKMAGLPFCIIVGRPEVASDKMQQTQIYKYLAQIFFTELAIDECSSQSSYSKLTSFPRPLLSSE